MSLYPTKPIHSRKEAEMSSSTITNVTIETHAVTREISNRIVDALSMDPSHPTVSLQVARSEHEHYNELLREILQDSSSSRLCHTIIDSSIDGHHMPDSVFIEDTAIVTLDTVLITQPGAVLRRSERRAVSQFFTAESTTKSRKLYDMSELDSGATMDGGDVLCIEFARLIIVGLSKRTNERGIAILRRVFPSYQIWTVRVGEGALHLKSFCSLFVSFAPLGETVILVSNCHIGHDIARQIQLEKQRLLDTVSESDGNSCFFLKPDMLRMVLVPNVPSSNCLSIPLGVKKYCFAQFNRSGADSNENVIDQARTISYDYYYSASRFAIVRKKGYPSSDQTFQQLVNELGNDRVSVHELEYDELSKVDGALTCCSIVYLQERELL